MIDTISQLRLPVNRLSDTVSYHNRDMGSLRERLKNRRKQLGLTQKDLAKLAKVSQTTIADLERGRNQGSTEIASIAAALGVDPLWLTDNKGKEPGHEAQSKLKAYLVEKKEDEYIIPQHEDVSGAMGSGVLLRDQPGQIRSWCVTKEWAERNLPPNTGIQNLHIVTGFGDSMKGMYNSGDPLIVDAGVKACDYDAVYFFRIGDEGFIKRLQRIPGEGILVISMNQEYRDWYIKEDMDFEVFGRVLRAWKGENY